MTQNKHYFWAGLVLLLSIAYQVHCAIHGFDLTDEGMTVNIDTSAR